MTITLALSVLVPLAAVAVFAGVRGAGTRPGRVLRFVEDRRGIALQTVIIMVVLIAIAGGVATVLLTRGGEAVNQLEDTQINPDAAAYNNSALCEAAGHTWTISGTTGTCG